MNDQEIDLDLELKNAKEEEQRIADQLQEKRKRLKELTEAQDRRFNDPKERAKMLQTGNDMFDAGVKEYESKGYFCDVERDENKVIKKIIIKLIKSKNRVPRKKAGEAGSVEVMTNETFAEIYNDLGEEFNNKNIITALAAKSKEGYTDFKTQPALSKILKDGYKTIRFSKIGIKGRGVKYKKILQAL
jgi:hypothetical protein